MLEAMRRGAKSWVAKALIVLLIVSFAVWGIGDVFSYRGDSTVATVGDREVTVDQFANALERQRTRLSQEAGRAVTYSDMRAAGIDRQILQGLVRDAAFAAELERLGIAAPDEAVAEAIRQNPAFQEGAGGFSDAAYRMALARIGFTPRRFEELTRTLLGQQILTELARAATPVPPGMAQRMAAYREEAREATLIELPRDAVPVPGVPGEEALRAHYEENREAYREPERRSGQYLHVSIDALARRMAPGEEAVRAAYEADRERYATPATRTIDQLPLPRDRADALARRVTQGETGFEALAEELGEDPADLSLGTVTREELPEAVAAAVFAEEEPGVVGPVNAPVGPVLVRIREVEAGGVEPFEAVRNDIAARLARDRALSRAPELATRIEDMRAGGATLPEIAEAEPGIRHGRFEGLARDGTLADGAEAEGVVGRRAFIEEAFAALDFEEREILQTEGGGFFLVLVERIEESAVPSFEAVRDAVLADWRARERQKAVEARAAELAEGYGPRQSLAPMAGELGLETRQTGAFTRATAPRVLSDALVADLFAAREGALVHGSAAGGEGAVIARLERVVEPDPGTLAAVSGQIESRLAGAVAEDALTYFTRAVEARHEVTVDREAVNAVFDRLGAARAAGAGS